MTLFFFLLIYVEDSVKTDVNSFPAGKGYGHGHKHGHKHGHGHRKGHKHRHHGKHGYGGGKTKAMVEAETGN